MEYLFYVLKCILVTSCATSLLMVAAEIVMWRNKETETINRRESLENGILRIISDDIGYHGKRLSKVEELGKDAHKRIDDTRRHFGKDMLALAEVARSVDSHLEDRINSLEDMLLKKNGRKNAKSSKS